MRTISYLLIFVIFSALFISCEVAEGENLRKYYKNQNHSEELKGWWRQINYMPDHNFPRKLLFESYVVKFYSYSIHNGQYNTTEDYWYNDAEKIYFLSEPSALGKPDERSNYYTLNTTNDTLKIYVENPPYIYVKDTGL